MTEENKISNTEVTHWKVEDIIEALKQNPQKYKVEIPKYQRSIVWSKLQQEKLVKSIISGFPVGALLLYRTRTENDKVVYSLVDGLQRVSTIHKYFKNPTQFFNEDDIDDAFLEKINLFINNSKLTIDNYRIIVLNWIKSLKGFSEDDDFSANYLAEAIIEKGNLNLEMKEVKKFRETILKDFTRKIHESSNIKGFEIPIIIYSGEENNLPTIFERLNRQGTQLSKYQIYAATWANKTLTIKSKEIIAQIKSKYDALIEEGLTIENYDPNLENQKEFSAFEYFLGLGKYIRIKYKKENLFSNTTIREDPIGFNLSAVCLGLSIRRMSELPDKFKSIGIDSDEKFEKALFSAIEIAYNILRPYIALKSNNKKGRTINKIYHTDFQIIAIISVIFQIKFDITNNLEIKKNYEKEIGKIEQNIIYQYLYDVIRGAWKNQGQDKAHSLKKQLKYKIKKKDWNFALDEWFSDELRLKEKKRESISLKSLLFLNFIYTHTTTAHEQLSNKKLEIEHIVPFSRLQEINTDGLPMSCIANICLIDKNVNRGKKDKTIYEYIHNEIEKENITEAQGRTHLKEIEKFTITNSEILEFCFFSEFNSVDYFKYLNTRFKKLKNRFFHVNEIHH